jgi:hypothetical protein
LSAEFTAKCETNFSAKWNSYRAADEHAIHGAVGATDQCADESTLHATYNAALWRAIMPAIE